MTLYKHLCRKCGTPLIIGENVTQMSINHSDYICRTCATNQSNDLNHITGRNQSMSENRSCPQFLGIHVAEEVLSRVFKNVHRMLNNNQGYDFICGGGYMIDVKASCRGHPLNQADRWLFTIKKNKIAEYFLLLAFDSRKDLNPEHIWLIPGGDINDHAGIGISETTLDKWKDYELPTDKLVSCCDAMR